MALTTFVYEVTPLDKSTRLEVVHVDWGRYQSICSKGEFKRGDRVVYIAEGRFAEGSIPPQLSFLGVGGEVKPIRIMGEESQGVLLPISALPGNTVFEDDVDVSERIGFIEDPRMQTISEFMRDNCNKLMKVSLSNALLFTGIAPGVFYSYPTLRSYFRRNFPYAGSRIVRLEVIAEEGVLEVVVD